MPITNNQIKQEYEDHQTVTPVEHGLNLNNTTSDSDSSQYEHQVIELDVEES